VFGFGFSPTRGNMKKETHKVKISKAGLVVNGNFGGKVLNLLKSEHTSAK